MKRSSKKLSEMLEKWRKRKKVYFAVYTKEGKKVRCASVLPQPSHFPGATGDGRGGVWVKYSWAATSSVRG